MKSFKIIRILLLLTFLTSCSSSELVENWKNPDIDSFEAEKVLVLAMTNDVQNRKDFEKRLVKELKKKNVNAYTSEAFFDASFTSRPQTEEELNYLEYEMLKEGYDAILVSKLVGAEDKVTLVQAYRNFDKTFNTFEEDYRTSQDIYVEDEHYEKYTVYHAETALYCICPTKEREIIWKGSIDLADPESNTRKAIKDYVSVLLWALEEQKLLVFEPTNTSDENTSL